jgi:hypothetical protein
VGPLLGEIWTRATTPQPLPSSGAVLAAGAAVLLATLVPAAWHAVRHVVTLVHEGGHAGVALITGRRLAGIRLHTDTSGLTLSVGRPRGPGMVATAAAGYPAPAVAGLAAAWLVARGYGVGLLWLALVAAVLLLLAVRNLYGLAVLLLGAAGLGALSWWAAPTAQVLVAVVVAWALLLGAPRAVLELQGQRRRHRRATTDADMLARLSRVPAILWVGLFLAGTCAALVAGGWWLLGGAGVLP